MKQITEMMRALRDGRTEHEVAELLQISRESVNRLTNGRQHPRYELGKRIEALYQHLVERVGSAA